MSDKEIKLPIDTSLGKLPQKEKGSLLPIAVSYTHLTLPTTPYV